MRVHVLIRASLKVEPPEFPTPLRLFLLPIRCFYPFSQVGANQSSSDFQQFIDQSRFCLLIGSGIGCAFDYHTQQFGYGITDGVLTDGDNELAFVIAIDKLFEGRLLTNGVGVFGIGDTAVTNLFGGCQKFVVE